MFKGQKSRIGVVLKLRVKKEFIKISAKDWGENSRTAKSRQVFKLFQEPVEQEVRFFTEVKVL